MKPLNRLLISGLAGIIIGGTQLLASQDEPGNTIVNSTGMQLGDIPASSFEMVIAADKKKGKENGMQHRIKIGICDWTISKRTEPASLASAKQLGLDGVQVDFGGPQDGKLVLFDPKLQKKFLAEARKHKVQIGSLAMGILNEYPLKSDPRSEAWVAEGIKVCRSMGVKVMLLAFFGKADLKNDPNGTSVVVAKLKRLAPQAQKAGVTLAIESWLSAEEHLDIIKRVGSRAVKVYYDVGNSSKMGYDIYKEIRALGSTYICEFHAKDYKGMFGKGAVDFKEVRRAMDDIAYSGWIQIESVKIPLGIEETCRQDGQYLRKIFGYSR
jgi:sugar phosphate isomerase/epimerase